ncbi:MAG: hypothetical protein HDS26_01305 [Bacteroides sp.]|nr:hypothetical protein [Bacteroides sp.]
MKQTFMRILVIIFVALLLAGCGGGVDRARLERAETLMDERPDSSLQILDSIDASRLRGGDRALYALLLTQARDKNHLDLSNDSIINESVDYYGREGDLRRLGKSIYFRGRMYYQSHDYRSALLDFSRSKEIFETIGDPFFCGLSCRGIGDIYWDLNNSEDALVYTLKEYEYMKESGRRNYAEYALSSLGIAYHNCQRYDEARRIASQLQREAGENEEMLEFSHKIEALCLQSEERYSEALVLWNTLMGSSSAQTLDSLRRCQALLETGQLDEGERFFREISDDGSLMRHYLNVMLAGKKGDVDEAFRQLARYNYEIQDYLNNTQQQKLGSTMGEEYELRSRLYRNEIKTGKLSRLLLLSVLLFFLVISIVVFIILRKRSQERVRQTLAKVMELTSEKEFIERDRDRIAESCDELEKKRDELEKRHDELEENIRKSRKNLHLSIARESTLRDNLTNVMNSRLGLLKIMHSIMEGGENTKSLEIRRLIRKVTPYIKQFEIKKEELIRLESYVDDVYDSAMRRFRQEVILKEEDYQVYLLSLLGQPCAIIAGLLGFDSISRVYVRRKHIRGKIENQVPEERVEVYLKWMVRGIDPK